MGKEKVQSQPVFDTLPQVPLVPPTKPKGQPPVEISPNDEEEFRYFVEAQIYIKSLLMVP